MPTNRTPKPVRSTSLSPTKTTVKAKRRTQAERSEKTRSRVMQAAASVLRRKGYAGLRTEEVSRVARVSRGAQQYHYPTKDRLVVATAEHLLRGGAEKGRKRAEAIGVGDDPIEAIIQDSVEFFLGPDFGIVLDLVLAGTKERSLREKIYAYARENRLSVEESWVKVLRDHDIPSETAEKVVWLTISMVRGLSVRALWQRDEQLFRGLLDEWKQILASYLKPPTPANADLTAAARG